MPAHYAKSELAERVAIAKIKRNRTSNLLNGSSVLLMEDYKMSVYRVEGTLGTDGKIVITREISFESESHLEQLFENSPFGLNQDEFILWIGKRTHVQSQEKHIFPDLLGIDSQGNLVIVEFKRGRSPREVVSQLFEYAAWAAIECSDSDIFSIAETYFLERDVTPSTLNDQFRDAFDIPDDSDIPKLNQRLRLFVVAEDIPNEVSRVCRWQRTLHGLDITCIEVSLFQTELNETYIDMEVKVGEEDIDAAFLKHPKQLPKPSPKSLDKPAKDIVFEAVQQLTQGDKSVEWTLREMRQTISKEYADFSDGTANNSVYAECVNHNCRQYIPGGQDRYWKVKRSVYKLYDPETDKEGI